MLRAAIDLFSGFWFQRHTSAMLDQETLLARSSGVAKGRLPAKRQKKRRRMPAKHAKRRKKRAGKDFGCELRRVGTVFG
jgi:hypothetical protein